MDQLHFHWAELSPIAKKIFGCDRPAMVYAVDCMKSKYPQINIQTVVQETRYNSAVIPVYDTLETYDDCVIHERVKTPRPIGNKYTKNPLFTLLFNEPDYTVGVSESFPCPKEQKDVGFRRVFLSDLAEASYLNEEVSCLFGYDRLTDVLFIKDNFSFWR